MITQHAQERINNRFAKLLNPSEIAWMSSTAENYKTESKTYLVTKKFSNKVETRDADGHWCRGDVVVAVVRSRKVITVILVNKERNDYYSDGKLIDLQ